MHNSITTEYAYNDAGQLLSEIYSGSGSLLDGLSVTNGYDQYLRRTNLILLNSSSDVLAATGYGYDSASRLQTVGSADGGVYYGYLANSPLVSTVVFQQSGNTRMTTTKSYDNLNRLKSVGSALSPGLVVNSGYTYNSANQRTGVTKADGSYWVYTDDALGQVQRGAKYFADNTIVPGQQFDYTFDDIGNRKTAKTGGDQNGQNQRTNEYTLKANGLNQYETRTRPTTAYAEILGVAAAGTTVNVTAGSSTAAAWRKGEYFRRELAITDSGTLWQGVTVNDGTTTTTGNLFLPATPENYTYDLDGNLTQDGRWDYLWDAENRLTRMTSRSGAPSGSVKRLEFVYDHQGRRIGKKVWNNTAGTGDPVLNQKFVYDGWNLIAVLSSSSSLLSSFTWGLDLSGSIQGAGGVGGLLVVTDAALGTHFCAYDGNGNVRALVNAANGTLSAGYEYGPFGELIRKSGVMANASPFRFSTKYQDDESDQLYYGYRSYNSSAGRWLNRDPLGEPGFELLNDERGVLVGDLPNPYVFVHNDSIDNFDRLGLYGSSIDQMVRTCMAMPTPAQKTECFRNLAELMGGGQEGRCKVLKATTQVAKKIASSLGGCKGTDSCVVLQQKSMAWIALVMARIAENKYCWCGGNPGHKQALQDAWNAIANCTKHQVNNGCTSM